jgi:hypothetical protein
MVRPDLALVVAVVEDERLGEQHPGDAHKGEEDQNDLPMADHQQINTYYRS